MAEAAIELWFNPRCSKARAARDLLTEHGTPFRLRDYVAEPPDRAELESVLDRLGAADPLVITRTKEAAWTELGLDGSDRSAVLDALVAAPALIERPIALTPTRGVVGRPPERVLELP